MIDQYKYITSKPKLFVHPHKKLFTPTQKTLFDTVAEFFGKKDPIYNQAVQIVIDTNRISAGILQRKLKIQYQHALELLEEMERQSVISGIDQYGFRNILIYQDN